MRSIFCASPGSRKLYSSCLHCVSGKKKKRERRGEREREQTDAPQRNVEIEVGKVELFDELAQHFNVELVAVHSHQPGHGGSDDIATVTSEAAEGEEGVPLAEIIAELVLVEALRGEEPASDGCRLPLDLWTPREFHPHIEAELCPRGDSHLLLLDEQLDALLRLLVEELHRLGQDRRVLCTVQHEQKDTHIYIYSYMSLSRRK
jgi:hypothetical protein